MKRYGVNMDWLESWDHYRTRQDATRTQRILADAKKYGVPAAAKRSGISAALVYLYVKQERSHRLVELMNALTTVVSLEAVQPGLLERFNDRSD